MVRAIYLSAVVLTVASLTGCTSSAQFVERTPTGGTVAVPDYEHRGDGLALIRKSVGPNYTVVHEDLVPTGNSITKTTTEAGTGSVFARVASWFTGQKQVASSETTTVKPTEYRITYTTGQPGPVPLASPGVVQTQYISPGSPQPTTPPAIPLGPQSRLTTFDHGRDCKL
jgi:hypothetical protein